MMNSFSSKTSLLWLSCLCLSALVAAQTGGYKRGTVIRMHMGDCILSHHGFISIAGGPGSMQVQESCPEYTLVTNDAVFVIVGKASTQLIPLTETLEFRFHKNELDVRVDDAKREIKFAIKEMMMRQDWDRRQRHIEEEMRLSGDHSVDRSRN
jgi:hypothetical protein